MFWQGVRFGIQSREYAGKGSIVSPLDDKIIYWS